MQHDMQHDMQIDKKPDGKQPDCICPKCGLVENDDLYWHPGFDCCVECSDKMIRKGAYAAGARSERQKLLEYCDKVSEKQE